MCPPRSEYAGNCLSVTRSMLVSDLAAVLRSPESCVVVSVSLDGTIVTIVLKGPCDLRVKRRRAGWSADGDIGKALVLLMYVYIKAENPHALYSLALSPPAARVQRCPSRMQRSLTDIILSVAEYAETN